MQATRSVLIFCICAQTGHCGSVARAWEQESPPITLINEFKTSSGKRVANNITLAAAHAPAKKVAPSASAPDMAHAPIFLDNPQVTVAVKAKIHPPVHAPGTLVEILVGLPMSCRGRLCEEHKLCRDKVLKEDEVVRLRMVQLVVD